MNPGKPFMLFKRLWRRRDRVLAPDPHNTPASPDPDASEKDMERDALKGDLKRIGSKVQEMAQSSEQDFLVLGEKLQSLWQMTSGIAEKGGRAAKLMSGKEISDSIDRVHNMLNRMDRYLAESSRRMEQNFNTFQVLLDSIYRAERPLAGLHRTVTGLQTLGISTRIESALIAQRHQNFVFLADEVNIQSEKIKAHSDDLLDKMQSLAGDISQTLNNLRDMHETHQGSGGTILNNLRESLSALVENQNMASASAQRLSETSEVLSQSMGQVVISMQFHDITRQQIEHVKLSLDDLADQDRDDVIGKGCELQAAQIHHSQGELSEAAGGLQKNLNAIAQSVRELVQEMSGLSGMQPDECSATFGGLEFEMTSAASRLAEYRQAEQSFSETLESFVQMLEGMKDFSGNIEMIGRSIKFVALNATIQAARIGREGAAMDVVAQGIRQLSSEAKDQTDIIAKSLEKIQEGAHRLHQNAQLAVGEEQGGLVGLSQDMNHVMAGICRQSETVIQLVREMDHTGRNLADDTEHLSRNITVHHQMNRTLSRAEQEIRKIGRWFTETAQAQGVDTKDESLAELTARYTMDSERLVHDDILVTPSPKIGGENVTEAVVAGPSGSGQEDPFELFGDDGQHNAGDTTAEWDDNIDLFAEDDPVPPQDETNSGVKRFENPNSERKTQEDTEETEDDLGDNVELF